MTRPDTIAVFAVLLCLALCWGCWSCAYQKGRSEGLEWALTHGKLTMDVRLGNSSTTFDLGLKNSKMGPLYGPKEKQRQ